MNMRASFILLRKHGTGDGQTALCLDEGMLLCPIPISMLPITVEVVLPATHEGD